MAEYTGPLLDAPAAPTTPTAKPKQKPYVPLQQVMPNAPPAASQAATVQPLNAQLPEFVPSPPPAGLTPKARNEFIANEANRVAAKKIEKQAQASALPPTDFSAKAKKLKDFEGYLTDYKTELEKDLMVFPKEIPIIPSQGMAIPLPVGSDTARMNSKYTALLMGLKDAYELGALTGPDMSIVESQLTNPATIAGALTSRDAMKEQVKVMEGLLNRAKQNLESSYGRKMDFGAATPSNPSNDPLGLRTRKP
jgi:hypothetical protein